MTTPSDSDNPLDLIKGIHWIGHALRTRTTFFKAFDSIFIGYEEVRGRLVLYGMVSYGEEGRKKAIIYLQDRTDDEVIYINPRFEIRGFYDRYR